MEQITTCAFGWYLLQKRFSQHSLKQRDMNLPTSCPLPVIVVSMTAVLQAPMVHQRITRAAVKTNNFAIGVQHTQVGDTADIEYA